MNETTPDNDSQEPQDIAAQENPSVSTSDSDVPQDSRNLALLIWIGTIFLSFIPGLIVFLIKKDDAYVYDQAKEALNWSITVVIGYVASLILTIILIGPLLMFAIGACNLVFGVLGAIGCSKGEQFRVPWTLRLVK
ncbi:MAG: DUF4870 domain-containing protein [Gammaproteobacteria bacterium]